MASKNSIGGFFVDLGLQLDKNSFETGNKYIDGITNGFNKLIGTARNASVATGVLSSAELKTATLMGVATEKLDAWKAAASIAGVNVNGLVSSMSKLADVMNHVNINGQGLSQYSKNLALLGMDVSDLLALDPAEAYQRILETAQAKIKGGMTPTKVYAALQDVIGTEGTNLLTEINRKGLSVSEFLSGASATQFMTGAQYEKGANFISEVNVLKEELKSIGQLLGTEVGGELTPYLKSMSDWVIDHKDDISNGIKIIAENVERIAEKVAPFVSWLFEPGEQKYDQNLLNNMLDRKRTGFNIFGNADYTSLSDTEKDSIARYYGQYGNVNDLHIENYSIKDLKERAKRLDKEALKSSQTSSTSITNANWWEDMNDGIMRPDGTITKVAPDDWVFAARNVGDLAKAFIPQSMAAGAGAGFAQFSIVQNFTINGSKDLPQTIRQQAYRGVSDGLQYTMSQAGKNLQQMSGTR